VTIPADTFARLIEAFARAHYDEPKAPCAAKQTGLGWIVATLVGGEPVTDELCAVSVRVETSDTRVTMPGFDLRRLHWVRMCPECGKSLGESVEWVEDALGDEHLCGCSLCVAHLEREAAEARTDHAVDNAEQRAEGW
jgi:hypothetical protein